ncbi:MAG: hypothetical protein E7186_02545 [Erysipelotrichaceae bacterium]|nr:hypothetical protein [Erysipelotrichaceae bacterium]
MDDSRVSHDFRLCDDGVYRWVYEYDLWKNHTVILEIEKFFILACMGIMVIQGLIEIPQKGFIKALISAAQEAGILLGIMSVLLVISYPIYCLLSNGKYCVLFEMDDKGIMHTRMEKKVKREDLVEWLWAANEILDSRLLSTSLSIATASEASMETVFSEVRKMSVSEKGKTITLVCRITRNQVYVPAEKFEFVKKYILERCPENVQRSQKI